METHVSLLLSVLLQVGPNPAASDALAMPQDMLNRPPRQSAQGVPTNPTSAWLSDCLDQLAEDPARAHSKAQIKLTDAAGADRVIANHCLGLAATELNLWSDARTAFVSARDGTPADEMSTRARFGTMAGNAALAGGDAATAIALFAQAESDAESAASATLQALAAIDRARALVAMDRPDEALGALNKATQLEPARADGWLFTATLLRRMDRLSEAQSAIERAIALAPQDAQIGLEAGVIAVLSGRSDAARKNWQSVIEIQPDSLAAQTARTYLDQIGAAPENASPTP